MKPYYEQDGIVLFHADCRDILPTLDAKSIDLVVTDPPYGIDLQDISQGGRHGRKRKAWEYGIDGDEDQSLGNFVLEWAESAGLPTVAFASPKLPWPGKWSSLLVWNKGPAVGGGGDVRRCWKQTWELIQIGRAKVLNGKRDEAVLNFWVTPDLSSLHPAAKPVPLVSYLIGKMADPGALVLDPFAGGGSTLRAAKDNGYRAIGIETKERYCELMVKRLRQGVLFTADTEEAASP